MSRPSPENIAVSLEALRTDARRWSVVNELLSGVHHDITTLQRRPALEFGIFLAFFSAYDAGCVRLAGLVAGGQSETARIADTLCHVADVYQEEEQVNTALGLSIHEIHQEW